MEKLALVLFASFAIYTAFGQGFTSTFDERSGMEIMLGTCNMEQLKSGSFAEFFSIYYSSYEVNQDIVAEINDFFQQNSDSFVSICIVLGTWCGDSHEQVPPFVKVLENINSDNIYIENIFCVDRNKTAPNIDLEELFIERVPTFIFYKNGMEIGRIVETPQKSLEADILDIIN